MFKGSNRKSIHVVAWNRLTDAKTDGGLAIKNLAIAKHTLMAKNDFKFLNSDDALWGGYLVP